MEWSRGVALVRLTRNIQIVSRKRRTTQKDPWDVYSELCRQVVEEGNVYLDVFVYENGIHMQLMPMDDDFEEEDK